MRAARSRDTAPELALRSALHAKGLRYTIAQRPVLQLNRKADIVFRSARVAVFVDGCFWHGCPFHGTASKANADFWRKKIQANRARDLDTNRRLRSAGWIVVRVWEHEDVGEASRRVLGILSTGK
jgi:DNA mismatch endonuclease (patch repair protein)